MRHECLANPARRAGARGGMSDNSEDEAIEAGITAAAEEIDRHAGRGRRWRAWGEKEMLVAGTAAQAAVAKWRQIQEGTCADTVARPASQPVSRL
jgi:hypothetical protein